jgi:hypothetical protein
MRDTAILMLLILFANLSRAQNKQNYQSLDASQPIVFGGDHIVYMGKKIVLGSNAFFVDGQLSHEITQQYPFVYNNINEAVKHLSQGTEETPVMLYLAPWVYWIDNPDDPAIRTGKDGGVPYGLEIACEWLHFYGLSNNPSNVVLACNRGQTLGAVGNFTMFKFIGNGTAATNITFGNYCNVDLEFPLKPELNRPKRASAIVQAQLIHCNGDKIIARNCRFISRLNLCPFVGGKRVLFDGCHFESTDDALCGTGVYINCTLHFYASKPFYHTTGTGAVFLNCDITSFTQGDQYFTKANGQLAVVNTRFTSDKTNYVAWRDTPPLQLRNYQHNVTLNNQSIIINNRTPQLTVNMDYKPVLGAYMVRHGGQIIYNTFNLLRGNDNWDPLNVSELIYEAEKAHNTSYTMLPTQLLVTPATGKIETGNNNITLTAKALRFGNYEAELPQIEWHVSDSQKSLVILTPHNNGQSCTVTPSNFTDSTEQVIIIASAQSGLEAAALLTLPPLQLITPGFDKKPRLKMSKQGELTLNYQLNMILEDQSVVKWYRCSNSKGANPIEVAVSRFNKPLRNYQLTVGDVGYFIMASIAPKHSRCEPGQPTITITKRPITVKDINTDNKILHTDFRHIPVQNQPLVKPGFWTFDHFVTPEGYTSATLSQTGDAWHYGQGEDGAANTLGLMQGRSASMGFTPVGKSFGDMKLKMTVLPFKTAGQGFSVAPLYMDILIKYDVSTKNGYGLRFIRTTKYHDAVDCIFVKYNNGKVSILGEPVSTSCFRPTCTIEIEMYKNTLKAKAYTNYSDEQLTNASEVKPFIDMQTNVEPNILGGFGIEYNGGSPTLIKDITVIWEN